jgi:hypothetical protein
MQWTVMTGHDLTKARKETMQEKLIVGLIGVVTGFLGALLKSWLDSRLSLDTETRKERWTVYKVAAKVEDPEYDRVQEACSALRTQLTKDLLSRQRGALHYLGI